MITKRPLRLVTPIFQGVWLVTGWFHTVRYVCATVLSHPPHVCRSHPQHVSAAERFARLFACSDFVDLILFLALCVSTMDKYSTLLHSLCLCLSVCMIASLQGFFYFENWLDSLYFFCVWLPARLICSMLTDMASVKKRLVAYLKRTAASGTEAVLVESQALCRLTAVAATAWP